MKKHLFFISFLIGSLLSSAVPVQAQFKLADADKGFDPNAVLTDNDIFDAGAFPLDRMTEFLRRKGTLADTKLPDIDGVVKPIPQIIWRVSQSYKMNPKYLIALLQKEQSLVEDSSPTQKQFDWATGYAVCDSCSMNDPSIQQFKGFASQLEWSAKQHREKYLMQLLARGFTIGGVSKGKTIMIDGLAVKPVNNATAMLYTYTPHIHGNLNLWRIWKRWFSVTYPDGTVVRSTSSKKTYLIRFGEKRPYASPAVAASMVDEKKIISVSDTELQNYPEGSPIKFANYSLLRNPKNKLFLLVNDVKRPIDSLKTFKKLGFIEDEIQDVGNTDLESYPDGQPITQKTAFPQGVLVKVAKQPGVWYVEDGVRQPLVGEILLKLYFRGRHIKTVPQKTLDGYTVGDPYKLHDGELVKSSDAKAVYVVENGILRPIPSGEAFDAIGWKWSNVVTVPANVINIHPIGLPFVPTDTQTRIAHASL